MSGNYIAPEGGTGLTVVEGHAGIVGLKLPQTRTEPPICPF